MLQVQAMTTNKKPTVNISMSPRAKVELARRARLAGFASVSEYLRSIVNEYYRATGEPPINWGLTAWGTFLSEDTPAEERAE